MKSYLQPTLLVTCALLSHHVLAEEVTKQTTIDLGTYELNVADYNTPAYTDDQASGSGVSASFALTNQFAIRGAYYSQEYDLYSEIDAAGLDIVAYIGTPLATQGFKAHIGAGLFNETWEYGATEVDFSGIQLNGGIGYNWETVALDFVLGIRDPSNYESLTQQPDLFAVSGSLFLSARF